MVRENSGPWKNLIVRNEWMKDKNITNYKAKIYIKSFRNTRRKNNIDYPTPRFDMGVTISWFGPVQLHVS